MEPLHDAAERERVAAALAALGAAVRQRRAEVASAGIDGDELTVQVADMRQREFVQEPQPISPRPGLGRLIVFARKAVYHLFGKWHARAVLQQQNEFNQSVATLVAGVVERERDQRRELARLRARVERLEERLERLAGGREPGA
jgi:cell division protein FtsB